MLLNCHARIGGRLFFVIVVVWLSIRRAYIVDRNAFFLFRSRHCFPVYHFVQLKYL
jgi:hypothetical protein